jgi:hypothetical protein
MILKIKANFLNFILKILCDKFSSKCVMFDAKPSYGLKP